MARHFIPSINLQRQRYTTKENIPSLKSFLSCGYEQIYEDDDNYRVLLNFQNLIKPKLITNESICYDQTRDTSECRGTSDSLRSIDKITNDAGGGAIPCPGVVGYWNK